MYDRTITLFNYHAATRCWYPSIIHGVDVGFSQSSRSTREGRNSADNIVMIVHTGRDKSVLTTAGVKPYMEPKAYAECSSPAGVFTFAPEKDFFYEGAWADLTPVAESEEDEGFYQTMNDSYDGVHIVRAAEYFGLLPHFEIGGK